MNDVSSLPVVYLQPWPSQLLIDASQRRNRRRRNKRRRDTPVIRGWAVARWTCVMRECHFELEAIRTLAPKHPRTEGLCNATSNMAQFHELVQLIDYSRYKRHALSDWSIIIEWLPVSTVSLVFYSKVACAAWRWMNKKIVVGKNDSWASYFLWLDERPKDWEASRISWNSVKLICRFWISWLTLALRCPGTKNFFVTDPRMCFSWIWSQCTRALMR